MKHILCIVGRHAWVPWSLCDETRDLPIVRLWSCARKRCQRIESLR